MVRTFLRVETLSTATTSGRCRAISSAMPSWMSAEPGGKGLVGAGAEDAALDQADPAHGATASDHAVAR